MQRSGKGLFLLLRFPQKGFGGGGMEGNLEGPAGKVMTF
jgi:hypothetical protein